MVNLFSTGGKKAEKCFAMGLFYLPKQDFVENSVESGDGYVKLQIVYSAQNPTWAFLALRAL